MLLAACGGSSSSGKTRGTASSSSATVITKKVAGYGSVLATPSGKTLYLLTADPSGGSKCTGSCTSQWPPLTAKGSPTAGPGVNSSMLSTFKRSDGNRAGRSTTSTRSTPTPGSGLTSGAGSRGRRRDLVPRLSFGQPDQVDDRRRVLTAVKIRTVDLRGRFRCPLGGDRCVRAGARRG